MLKFFQRRDTAVRYFLGGFLVLICISMVLYLIPGFGSGDDSSQPIANQTIATVDGNTINGQALAIELNRVEQGQQIPAQLAPMFGRQILKNMVIEQALADEAQHLGLAATSAEIVETARTQNPELFPNGRYVGDAQASQALAQTSQFTLSQFQDQLREDVLANKVYDLVTDPVRVGEADVHAEFVRQNEKAKFDYVLVKPADVAAEVVVTPQALQTYYQQHLASYNSPERRQLEILLANQTQLAAQIQISDAEVAQYYRQNLATFSHPERVKAAHILLKFPGTPGTAPSAADLAATRAKAEDVLKQVDAPHSDFAALAKKYSQDEGSATQGGELGYLVRGQTVAGFEKAAFSLPVGQISGLIQTEYGFHIIKVEAHEPARVQTLAEVHDQIVQQMQKDQAATKAENLMNQAQTLATRTPLPQVAQQLNLQYFTTAPLGRADPITGIGVNPDFANAVFAASAGGITAPVQVAQGFALAKVVKIVPPGPQPLDAVKDAVTADFKQDQSKQLARTKAQALDQAAQKQGLKAAAAALKLTVKTSDPLPRTGSLADGGAISPFADALFQMKPQQVGGPAALGDNQIVYSLDSLQEPTDAEYAAQRNTTLQNLLQQKRSAVFQAYSDALVAQLTKAGKIKMDEAAFQRVVGGGAPDQPPSPSAPVNPGSPLG